MAQDKDVLKSAGLYKKAITTTDLLWWLIQEVGSGKLTLQDASSQLREHVRNMTEEERAAWKSTAGDEGRKIMRVAEAFNQEVTVIAAGQ